MPTITKHTLTGTIADALGLPGEAEMQLLESVVRPLVANGFEFRGGDVFGQEVLGIYMHDALDEFVMLRYNRPADADGRAQPPLIVRGAMAELDQPMDAIDTLKFVTIPEFLGQAAPSQPEQQRQEAANQNNVSATATAVFKPFGPLRP